MTEDKMGLHGEVRILLIRDGEIIGKEEVHNITTNVGIAQAIGLIAGAVSGTFGYIGIGSSTVTPAATDTGLGHELLRVTAGISITTTVVTNDTILFDGSFLFSSTATVAEAGVFNSSLINGGIILGHVVFGSVYSILAGDQMQVAWSEVCNGS